MTVENTSPESTAPATAAPSVAAPVAAVGAAPSTNTAVEITAPVVVETTTTETPTEVKSEPAKATTVLGSVKDAAAETKLATEAPKEGEVKADGKKEEGGQSEEPAPLPPYEDFEVPEGLPETFKFDEKQLGEFKEQLTEFEQVTKAPRAEVQKFAQGLINRHVQAVQSVAERVADSYHAAWEKNKSDWKAAAESDPEIGGNRWDTSTNAALEFIRTHGGSEKQQNEFRELMETTGLGNHPAIIRLLANANTGMKEGGPLPAKAPAFTAQSKVAKRYGQA